MLNSDPTSQASACATRAPDSRPPEADIVRMSELNVHFDGRYYRYGQYRYDALADALAYAKLDHALSDYQAVPDDAPVWTDPPMPTAEEQGLMTPLDVTFDGRYYYYKSYRYDLLADAFNYARLNR